MVRRPVQWGVTWMVSLLLAAHGVASVRADTVEWVNWTAVWTDGACAGAVPFRDGTVRVTIETDTPAELDAVAQQPGRMIGPSERFENTDSVPTRSLAIRADAAPARCTVTLDFVGTVLDDKGVLSVGQLFRASDGEGTWVELDAFSGDRAVSGRQLNFEQGSLAVPEFAEPLEWLPHDGVLRTAGAVGESRWGFFTNSSGMKITRVVLRVVSDLPRSDTPALVGVGLGTLPSAQDGGPAVPLVGVVILFGTLVCIAHIRTVRGNPHDPAQPAT